MEFSNPNNARKINKLRVLNALLEESSQTRADLSRRLVLNKISISEIVKDLIDEGFIIEGDKTETTRDGGRPGTTLKLNSNKAFVIGLDIGTAVLRFAIADLTGAVIRFERIPLDKKQDLAIQILESLKRLLRNNNREIVALSIAVDGEVNNKKGMIYSAKEVIKEPYPIKAKLEEQGFKLPILLATQLEAEVKSERMFYKQPLSSFLFVNWGEYLSSAFITKTVIVENPDFGHINVEKQGLCHCGSIGCLDLYASGWGYKMQALNKLGQVQTVKQLLTHDEGIDILKDGIQKLGKALALALCSTGAKAIIMGGAVSSLPDECFSYLKECYSLELPHHLATVPLYRGNEKEKGTVQGAIYLALDKYIFSRDVLLSLNFVEY